MDEFLQSNAFLVKLPGAAGFELHELHKRGTGRRTRDIPLGTSEMFEILLRDIDAAHRVVFRDVAKNVGQLKCDSKFFCKFQCHWISKPEHVRTTEPDRSGNAIAIIAQLIECGVTMALQVHGGSANQVVK